MIKPWLDSGDGAHLRMILQLFINHSGVQRIECIPWNKTSGRMSEWQPLVAVKKDIFCLGKKWKVFPTHLAKGLSQRRNKRGHFLCTVGVQLCCLKPRNTILFQSTQTYSFCSVQQQRKQIRVHHVLWVSLQFRKTYPWWRSLWVHFHNWETMPKRQRMGQINKLAQNKY